MAIYTRQSDGAVLDYSQVRGSFDRLIGIYDFKRLSEFSYGEIAQARELASYLEQKTFTIELVVTDTTGAEQLQAFAFFKKGGKYSVTGPEFSLQTMSFFVVAIDSNFFKDSGADIISITCQAEFGDFVQETRTQLFSQNIAANTIWQGGSWEYTNATLVEQTFRFEIEKANELTNWRSNASTRLIKNSAAQGITVTLGRFSPNGVLLPATGKRILIDSYTEVIEGYATIAPMTAMFFKIAPGEATTIKMDPFNALPTSEAYTVRGYAYSVQRRES